jgi:predicted nucleic acid-binding protein
MSSTNVEFYDTNVLIFAFEASATAKHGQAKALVDRLWSLRTGAVSVQVLQEMFVVLTQKLPRKLPATEARIIVADIACWRVIEPSVADVLQAIDDAQRWRISFWDAMIVTAAARAGAEVLWTEVLSHGQTYDGVEVRSPFL